MTTDTVYLDHAATTPMRPAAVEAMLPFLTARFANPSGSHALSRDARRAVDDARDQVAATIGCRPGEVVFTSGGTEGDNAAIAGALRRCAGRAVCPAAEHHAVLHVVERHGGTVVDVDELARVDATALRDTLEDALTGRAERVGVVSIMAVNNEVGTINDLAALAPLVRSSAPDAVFHTDAVQAAGWLDLRRIWPHVDVLTLSAHKFGGPKGVGIAAMRTGVDVDPLIVGGGQERDRRSGTHNVAGIVATAAAMAEADAEREVENKRIGALRDRLVAGVVSGAVGVRETVPPEAKVPGSAHLLVEGVDNELLLYLLDSGGVCASAASACASGAQERSHVLDAMGIDREWSRGAVRMTLGHTTTEAEVDRAVAVAVGAIETLRQRMATAVGGV